MAVQEAGAFCVLWPSVGLVRFATMVRSRPSTYGHYRNHHMTHMTHAHTEQEQRLTSNAGI